MDKKHDNTVARRILFVGPSGAGKTYSMTQWLLQKIKDKWIDPANILIFAYNFMSDPSLAPLLKKCQQMLTKGKKQGKQLSFENRNCFKEIQVDLLQQLFSSQEYIKDVLHLLPPHYLLILDDQICNEIIAKKRSELTKVLTMGRHANISIIFCIQKYSNTINPILRENMNQVSVGRLQGNKEIKQILEQYSAFIPADSHKQAYITLETWYNHAVKQNENRGFVTIHCEQAYGNGRFQLGCIGDNFFDKTYIVPCQENDKQKNKKTPPKRLTTTKKPPNQQESAQTLINDILQQLQTNSESCHLQLDKSQISLLHTSLQQLKSKPKRAVT